MITEPIWARLSWGFSLKGDLAFSRASLKGTASAVPQSRHWYNGFSR
jgi:hypothetical protein